MSFASCRVHSLLKIDNHQGGPVVRCTSCNFTVGGPAFKRPDADDVAVLAALVEDEPHSPGRIRLGTSANVEDWADAIDRLVLRSCVAAVTLRGSSGEPTAGFHVTEITPLGRQVVAAAYGS